MDVKYIKEYIYEHNYIEYILTSIDCHSIKYHGDYWTCANFNGDNKKAVVVYNNDLLNCTNYTRDLTGGKDIPTDLISLVCYNKNISFSEALKYLCGLLELDYYYDPDKDIPESLKITRMILEMQQHSDSEIEEKKLKPIDEKILTYYKPYVNDLFRNDGVSYLTQKEFEIGYDEQTNYITIPIRDEIGSLVGVKGRIFKEQFDEDDLKYMYLEPCARSKILYGLYKTYSYIKQQGKCIIVEPEKGVQQLWDLGFYNSVGIGGKKVTRYQIEKLTRLGVDLIFAFDKDVTKEEIENISNRFVDGVPIYYIFDDQNILNDKESPMDNQEKWNYLYQNCLYRMK